MAKRRKGRRYIIWIALIAGLVFLGGVAVLYKGRGKIRTTMALRGKEPLEKGKIYARLNRNSEAISAFKKELEKNPTSFEAHFFLGHVYSRLAEFDQALAEYEKAQFLQPESMEAGLLIASTYLEKAKQSRSSGREDTAVSELLKQAMLSCEEVLKKQPNSPQAIVLKGNIYSEQNEPEKAGACFKEALVVESSYLPAHLGLIGLYMASRDYEGAELQCREALTHNPEDFSIYLNLATIYSQQGQYEKALDTLSKHTGNKMNQIQASVVKGLIYLRMGRYQEASEEAESASKLAHIDIPMVEYIQGVVALVQKDYPKAFAHLRQASLHMPRFAEAHYFLALALIETHKREEAKTELMSAITSDPEYLPAKLTLAQIMAQESRWDEALNYAKETLELDPENVFAVQLLGMAYRVKGEFDKARQEFTRLMRLDPLSANINLAYLDYAEGKIGKCLKTCDAVLAENPKQFLVLYLKGMAFLRSGDLTKAYQCFKETLELEPRFLPATHQLAGIFLATGRNEEAITVLKNNLVQNERDVSSRLLMARIYEEAGEVEKAKEEVKLAINFDEMLLPGYAALGRICILQKKYDQAVDSYQKAVNLMPSAAFLHIGLGVAYHSMGDLEKAEKAFLEAVRLTPNSPSCYIMLGNVYLHTGQIEKAVGIVENSPLTHRQKEIYQGFISDVKTIRPGSHVFEDLNEAIFFELNGSYASALERCKEVSNAIPGNTLVATFLGNLYTIRGKPEEALKVYEGLTLSGEFNLPAVYQEMGKLYLSMKDYDKAIWALEEATASNQASTQTRLQLSNLYLRKGNLEKAEVLVRDVLVQEPKNTIALNLLGEAYLRQGRLEEANIEFSKALGEGSLQDISYSNLARTKLAKGDIEGCIEECRRGLDKNSANPDLHYLLGTALVRKGETAEALEEFIEVANIKPSFVPAYLDIASIYNLQGKLDLASMVCNIALGYNPESIEARLVLGSCYLGLSRYDEAMEQYQKCLNKEGDNPPALLGLTTAYLLKGDTSNALETLQNYFNGRRDAPSQAYALLAEIYRREGDFSQAIATLENLLETDPKGVPLATLDLLYFLQGAYDKCINLATGKIPQLLWIKAVAYQLQGRYQEAEASCQEAVQALAERGEMYTTLSLANIALASGHEKKARAVIEQTTTLNAIRKQAYLKLIEAVPAGNAQAFAARMNSMLIYMGGGWVEQALEEYSKTKALVTEGIALSYLQGEILTAAGETEQAIRIFANIIQRDSSYNPAYEKLASLYLLKKDEEAALDTYKKLVKIEPNSGQAHLQLAVLLQRRGNIDECIEEYKKVIALLPPPAISVVASNNLAWVLATKKGKVKEAIELALEAKRLAPNSAGVIDTLGWVYYLNGQYTEALKELQRATRMAYGKPTMHYHLGVVYLKSGMNSQALAQLKKAISGGVDFPEQEEAKGLIKEIESGKYDALPSSTF